MDKSGTILKWFGAITSLVTIILVTILLVQFSRTQKKLESQRAELEQARMERARIQAFNEKIYQTVVSALETRDSTRQEIARALVTAMNDDPIRDQLLNVMSESHLTVTSVKKRIDHVLTVESTFEYEERGIRETAEQVVSEEWKKWNYDIFFLETKEPDSTLANEIKLYMLDNGCDGRIRVRILPKSVNMRTGYHVATSEIRYNTWEQQGALEVKQFLNGLVGAREVNFALRTVSMNTPNYVSIFVRRH